MKKKLLHKLWDGTKIMVVNGREVRDQFDNDFLLGGHGYVYKYIPKNEIWIEEGVVLQHETAIVAHELFEYYQMKHEKKSYPEAHKVASDLEKTLRAVSDVFRMATKAGKEKHKKGVKLVDLIYSREMKKKDSGVDDK